MKMPEKPDADGLYMVLDDTIDFGQEPLKKTPEEELESQKFIAELKRKYNIK